MLIWTTSADFGLSLTTAKDTFSNRVTTGGNRKTLTSELKTLDNEIDKGVSTIKSYLAGKYKSEVAARPYYGKFGITSRNGSYVVSKERSERLESLKQIKTAIVSEGFSNHELGQVYWTDMYDNYKGLFDEANTSDGRVSNQVGDKNTQAKQIRKVLNSIINLIKANNPDTWENELRTWGFRKDRF